MLISNGGYSLDVSIEVITPEVAAAYLERNVQHNRRLRPQHIGNLASLIGRDEWLLSHQSVAFDSDGRLIDGQHRLWAVLMSEKPAVFLVVRGVDLEVFTVTDRGVGRTVSDLAGQPHILVAIATALIESIARSNLKIDINLYDTAMAAYSEEVLIVAAPGHRRGSQAAFRAAFALRMRAEPDRAAELTQELYKACGRDQSMWPQIWATIRRIEETRPTPGEVFWRTFAATDRRRVQVPRLSTVNHETVLAEIEALHQRHAPELVRHVLDVAQRQQVTRRQVTQRIGRTPRGPEPAAAAVQPTA